MDGWEAWKEVCEKERVKYDTIAPRAESPNLPDLADCLATFARLEGKRKREGFEDDTAECLDTANDAPSSSKRRRL
ncbi:hypothetical protein V5O48_014396 [Marasmius crinis-equi]|uniref:Uncharacterized protein n=1 Tax=Marasmius crinis-equi TaxID=585013 RepID=A0ABR3EXG1_9AGAR